MRSVVSMRQCKLGLMVVAAAWMLLPSRACAEHWDEFRNFISEVDYAAQEQSLSRDGNVIWKRTIQEYWRSKDFDPKLVDSLEAPKGWRFRDYDRKTDRLNTTFVFYGRGTLLVRIGPISGAILYPGITDDGAPGSEVACSITEFHDLLSRIGALKAEGKDINGIVLPRLDSPKPVMP